MSTEEQAPANPPLPELKCDICSQEPALGVASSGLGPFSQAIGRNCLERGAESLWMLEYTIQSCGGLADMVPGFDQWVTWHEGRYQTVRELVDQGVISETPRMVPCEVNPEHGEHSQLEPCWVCEEDRGGNCAICGDSDHDSTHCHHKGMVVTDLDTFNNEEVKDG